MQRRKPTAWLTAGFILAAVAANAQQTTSFQNASGPMAGVALDQKLNQQVPPDIRFTDENGKEVVIGDYFTNKPVMLNLIFYKCPGVCSAQLDGMADLFRQIQLEPGSDFKVVTVSINPLEPPGMASDKKRAYTNLAGRDGLDAGWHFLVGAHDQIHRLADSIGYKYTEDLKKERFAHPAGIILLTPQGKISRYFFGVRYNPKDVRLGLVEASENRIGSIVDRFVLTTCIFQYDPMTGKYGLMVFRLLQIGGLFTILCLGTFIFVSIKREKRLAAAINTAKPTAAT